MEHLPRWIFASIAYYFKSIADANSIPYFVEGVDEREPQDMRQSHAEMRVTGPDIKEISNGYYQVNVIVNILLTSLMEMSGVNAYQIINWSGIFAKNMQEPVPIYKYGDGPEDDQSLIGCLRVRDGKFDSVKIWHFGQVSRTDRVRQSEVDVLYEMEVKSENL